MGEVIDFKQLREMLRPYTLLYVEDNAGLNTQATILFRKFFETVYSAHDGVEGLELFKLHHPAIIITDIVMPKLDGIKMGEAIKEIDPDAKIIITTAHDVSSYLHDAIRIGVFDYLTKPLKIDALSTVLERCAHELNTQLHRKIFMANMQAVFNYQNALVLLLHHKNVVMANQHCFDFFGVAALEEFKKFFMTFGDLLLEHKTFLYNHEGIEWFETLRKNNGKLFNIKVHDQENSPTHFVMVYQSVPDKEGYAILSLNNVNELGLLKLYDADASERDKMAQDESVVRNMLQLAQQNGAKIKIHNLYKGLGITNEGMIEKIEKHRLLLRAPQVQLKAIQHEKECFLSSELFIMPIRCRSLLRCEFENQNALFSHYQMVETSPSQRQLIRVFPGDDMSATMLYEGRKVESVNAILDTSIRGIRLELSTLPSGFEINHEVVLDIVITMTSRPTIVNTKARVLKITEFNRRFEVVLMYDLHGNEQKSMIDYVAKRQMVLILEFKGLQI